MKVCDFIEEYLKDDVIGQIYNNECRFAEFEPTTEEYKKITRNVRIQERQFLNVKEFKKYLEDRNIKDSIEAEENFKLLIIIIF